VCRSFRARAAGRAACTWAPRPSTAWLRASRRYSGTKPRWSRVRSWSASGRSPDGERELTEYMVAVLRREIPSRGGNYEPCLWLDPVTRRCRYYEHQPDVCRDFEVGSEG